MDFEAAQAQILEIDQVQIGSLADLEAASIVQAVELRVVLGVLVDHELERQLLARELLDQELLERQLLDRELLDRELLDRQLPERQLLDRELLARKRLERQLLARELRALASAFRDGEKRLKWCSTSFPN